MVDLKLIFMTKWQMKARKTIRGVQNVVVQKVSCDPSKGAVDFVFIEAIWALLIEQMIKFRNNQGSAHD